MTTKHEHDIDEKHGSDTSHLEDTGLTASSDVDHDEVYSVSEQKRIIHRIDRRLVVMTGVMYCVSLMDRTNMSAANLAGMNKSEAEGGINLNIDFRYNIAVLVFFITYVLFQPPATVLTREIGPRIFLASITLFWGATMIGFGFVKNFGALAGLRVLLGVLEAGFFPGSVYLLSTWYTRYDIHKRYSIFYLIGCVASAAAGILAFGLMQMNGLQGIQGWRWIFIIEGVLSCVIAIIGYVFLVDFPEEAHKSWKFITKEESDFIVRRVNRDRGDVHLEPFSLGKFLRPAMDLKIWGFALIFACTTTVSYSIAYFLPVILNSRMGFDVGTSQCLVAPPFAFAGIIMFSSAWVADKYHIRGPIIAYHSILCLIGLPIMGYAKSSAVQYFGVFLTTAGCNANVPSAMAYQANNIRGQWKRAFCSASLVSFGGIGGIAGSLIFRYQDAPYYLPGIWGCMVANGVILLTVAGLSLYFHRCNRKVDRGEMLIEGLPGFKYTL